MSGRFLTAIGQDPVLRARQADRRAVGRQHGRLPGRSVPTAVVRVERPVPRHRAGLLARRSQAASATLASRLAGSSDLYADDGRSPYASVNFVTAHDGFTLRDLVSYNDKHNEANGEDNRDGTDNNRSWNCGVEGETDDADDRRAAPAAGRQPPGHAVPVDRRPDDHRGRRAWPHPARQQQRLLPGQRDRRGGLASRRRLARRLRIARTALRLRREHPALRQRHFFAGRPTVEGGPKDLAWIHPRGSEMAAADWLDADAARPRHVRLRRSAARAAGRAASGSRTRRSCCGATPAGSRRSASCPDERAGSTTARSYSAPTAATRRGSAVGRRGHGIGRGR